jgi:hypothetical protein
VTVQLLLLHVAQLLQLVLVSLLLVTLLQPSAVSVLAWMQAAHWLCSVHCSLLGQVWQPAAAWVQLLLLLLVLVLPAVLVLESAAAAAVAPAWSVLRQVQECQWTGPLAVPAASSCYWLL